MSSLSLRANLQSDPTAMLIAMLSFLMPLIGFIAWTMSMSAHWMNSASEQIRLDAVALSLCHSQHNFYSKQIKPLNLQIRGIQAQMGVQAALCVAKPYICPAVLRELKRLSREGEFIMRIQDRALLANRIAQRSRLHRLKSRNNLGIQAGNLYAKSPGHEGLVREVWSKGTEGFQGVRPPLVLTKGANFEELNDFELRFRPKRDLIKLSRDSRRSSRGSELLADHRITLKAHLKSRCSVDWDHGVERRDENPL